ncbi:efflux transporter periplasmic adaptor subunit [Lewinellaceae bacterium SD302]|nr:efflux transporter periplasmic adaptor subunit [Lewinellaceae bacterium SD302]
MKNHLIIAVATLVVGFFLGYLIFGGKQSEIPDAIHTGHDHATEHSGGDGVEETWTCSMHPQIRQAEPGDCPICGMDLIPLTTNSSNDPTVLEMTEAAVALANIQTTTVGRAVGEEENTIKLAGRVEADERLMASQVAHVPGRIERLYVTFTGENVVAGQKLADIYSPDLITAQRELIEALRLREVNPALLDAARDKLRYWKIDEEFIAEVERDEKIREVFTLRADATGVVSERMVAVGDYVQRGEPLFNLVNLGRVWVLFDVYEDDLSAVSLGDRIEFTTPSLPDKDFSARITFVDPVIDPLTRTASVRTEVNNPRGRLKPEMLVYGELLSTAGVGKEELYVPKSAVLWTGTRSVVYVKLSDVAVPSYQYREVRLGESAGDGYAVLEGLMPGEEVVTYGNFTIDAAAQLNNQFSMMNREVTVSGTEVRVEVAPDFREETPPGFQEQLSLLVRAYLPLKDALVASDPGKVAVAAKELMLVFENADVKLLRDDAHLYWMEQRSAIEAHAGQLARSTKIEEQRVQFGYLSSAMINSLKAFGVIGDTIYVQHCPMAFNNEGADWLAAEEQINNPYFGDAMLKCGSITDEL